MGDRFIRELSDSLASTDPDHQTVGSNEQLAQQVLSDFSPTSYNPKTKTVLQAFLDHLPISGKHVLGRYISVNQDAAVLTEPSDHLCGAILAPSKFIFYPTTIVNVRL